MVLSIGFHDDRDSATDRLSSETDGFLHLDWLVLFKVRVKGTEGLCDRQVLANFELVFQGSQIPL